MDIAVNTLFTVANALLLVASFPLLHGVWKDRITLSGFNPYGALLTFVALLVFNVAYYQMGNWLSIVINASTVAFWGLATWFSWRN